MAASYTTDDFNRDSAQVDAMVNSFRDGLSQKFPNLKIKLTTDIKLREQPQARMVSQTNKLPTDSAKVKPKS